MTSQTKQNHLLPIAMMFALFFMISFVTGLQNPFGVIVRDQFQASNFMSQLGNAANFIAYAFMGIPAGLLLKRIGYKKTALLAILVGFCGVGISFLSGVAESFAVYLCGAFISGFSMCLLNSVVNPLLNALGGGGNKGNQLLLFGGSINSIGATITPVLAGILIGNVVRPTIADVNPALWIAMGIFALAFIVLYIADIPEPYAEEDSAAATAADDKHSALSFRHFKLGAVAIFAYMGIEVGVPNFVNLFLSTPTESQIEQKLADLDKALLCANTLPAETMISKAEFMAMAGVVAETTETAEATETEDVKEPIADIIADINEEIETLKGVDTPGMGMDKTTAGFIVGTYWFCMMLGRLFGGGVASRLSSRQMIAFVSILGIVLTSGAILLSTDIIVNMPVFMSDQGSLSFGMVEVPLGIMLLILTGFCTSVMWGGIFNLAVEGLGKYTSLASGIFMVMVCGGGLLPLVQGGIADGFGYIASFIVLVVLYGYTLYYALIGSKNVNTDIPTL